MAAESVLPTDAREAKLGQQPLSSEGNGEGDKPAYCQYALPPTSYKVAMVQSVPFNLGVSTLLPHVNQCVIM